MEGLAVYDDAIDDEVLRALRRRIRRYAKVDPGSRSFWIDLDSDCDDTLVGQIASSLRPIAVPDSGCTGVEWWVGVRDPADVFNWHFDRDEQLYVDERRVRHPIRASILYAGAVGGPTVVTDQVPGEDGVTPHPPTPRAAVRVQPRPRRFVVFDGRYYHCVAPSERPEPRRPRVTLLLNWWDQRPKPPICSDLSAELKQVFAPYRPQASRSARGRDL